MSKSVCVSLLTVFAMAAAVSAQQGTAATAKPAVPARAPAANVAAEPAKREAEGQPVNVKIEVSITDQSGSGTPARKVVTMMAADHQNTSIRSSASVPVATKFPDGRTAPLQYRNVTINVDARPWLVAREPNKVLISFGLEYQPKSAGGAEEMEPGMASLNERLSLVFESGKSVIVSQAADPTSDRKITVEVTATILR